MSPNQPVPGRWQCWGLAVTLMLVFPAWVRAATVSVYPLPSIYTQSGSYSLKVDGVTVPVVSYVNEYDYATFSMSGGAVTVEVTAPTQANITSYGISPKKLNITGTTNGNKLTFTLSTNQYLIVRINSLKRLVIAADPGEVNVPASSGVGIFNVTAAPYNADSNGVSLATTPIQNAINAVSAYGNANGQGIVYVPPGVYRTGNLQFKSDVAMYLAGGAVIRATDNPNDYIHHWYKSSQSRFITWFISTVTNGATNMKLYGRGTVDGNGYYLANSQNFGVNYLVPVGCTNFSVDGITFRDAGSWGIITARSRDLVFSNLKLLNHFNTGEDDGIDVCESQNVLVSNAVGIGLDDPFSSKTWADGTDIATNWPGTAQANSNVVFDGCLSWTYCYGFKLGQGTMQPQSDVTFRNGVVYDCAVALGVHHKWGAAPVNNVIFENMDIEKVGNVNAGHRTWAAFFIEDGSLNGAGPITNIVVRNINVRDKGTSGGIIAGISPTAFISGVTFDTIYMPGSNTPAANLYQLNIPFATYYNNLTILPTQIPEPPPPVGGGTNLDFEAPLYFTGSLAPSTAPGAVNAPFAGQQGWSYSTSGAVGAIVTTTSSGLYAGGQALGSGDAGNAYIGATTNVILGKKFQFDLRAPAANKAGVAGFVDLNQDRLFSQAESGVFAGVCDVGGVSYFAFRDQAASGTVYSSGVAAGTTNWYRMTVTLDDGTRTTTMEVTNLTAGGTAVDLNGTAAGTAFSRTWSAALWISPTNYAGLIGRASTTLLIDNIVVLEPAVLPPVTLLFNYAGATLQLTWNRGVLLEATNLAEPWTTNLGATSPFVVNPNSPQKFFRVLVQ